MTAHKRAHKTAHKNPRALRSGDGCARSARALAGCSWRLGRRLRQSLVAVSRKPQVEADLWWRDMAAVAGPAYCWDQDWVRLCR